MKKSEAVEKITDLIKNITLKTVGMPVHYSSEKVEEFVDELISMGFEIPKTESEAYKNASGFVLQYDPPDKYINGWEPEC